MSVDLNGTAFQEDLAFEGVYKDPNDDARYDGCVHSLSVKFIDFAGERKAEWFNGSSSSKHMQDVLTAGDPDGFELVTLNSAHTYAVQKNVRVRLSGLQKLGWPWNSWPWSDTSKHEVGAACYALMHNQLTIFLSCNSSLILVNNA